jgi:putative oxidoreductase
MNLDRVEKYTPEMLSVVRIVVALLFLEHGSAKLLGFPTSPHGEPAFMTLMWIQGLIELLGGALLALGLFTRPVAFILSGNMAVAYFMGHASKGFFPLVNGGDAAILYCFIFLLFFVTGPGRWNLDAGLTHSHRRGDDRARGDHYGGTTAPGAGERVKSSGAPKTALPAVVTLALRHWPVLPRRHRPAPPRGRVGMTQSSRRRRLAGPQTAPRPCRRDGCAPILRVRAPSPAARPSTDSRRPALGPGWSRDGSRRSSI